MMGSDLSPAVKIQGSVVSIHFISQIQNSPTLERNSGLTDCLVSVGAPLRAIPVLIPPRHQDLEGTPDFGGEGLQISLGEYSY